MEGVVYCHRGNDEDCHLKVVVFLFHFIGGLGVELNEIVSFVLL